MLLMSKKKFRIPVAKCLQCDHEWVPRIPSPARCAKCKSLKWNDPLWKSVERQVVLETTDNTEISE